jgi:PadR family transcriptional regulator, regulatory protein PadR
MSEPVRTDVFHGTIALMVLRSLEGLGPLHGYGIARRIEQISVGQVAIKQGSLYPALVKLEQLGWIAAKWGVSDNQRRARFYAITPAGRKQLRAETVNWSRASNVIGRFLGPLEDLP